MDNNHGTTGLRVDVVCGLCAEAGRIRLPLAVARQGDRGWSLATITRSTWLADLRRQLGDDAPSSDEPYPLPEGEVITRRQPPRTVVFEPGSPGRSESHLDLVCEHPDCKHAMRQVRVGKFMRRFDDPMVRQAGVTYV